MSTQKTTSTSSKDLLKYLYLLIPFAIAAIIGFTCMNNEDTFCLLTWICVLFLFAIAAYPLALYIFKDMKSGGFIFSMVIGILAVSTFVWELTYIGIYRFNFLLCYLALLILAGVSYGIPALRKNAVEKIKDPGTVIEITIEAGIFVLVLSLLCFMKGMGDQCMINGQEKFMDYGFVRSMLRNSELPAKDMWLSGYNINYYYFGQFVYALIIKMSGIYPGIGYNLAMVSAIAIPFAMAYSVGTLLMEYAAKYSEQEISGLKYVAGILSGLCVSIFGNSHSFFYDPESFGNKFLSFFEKLGADVGKTDAFFYPDSTRYIGHNPELTGEAADYTIEEFPFYSYLVSDLHAHVISMMVVLLILAVCIVAVAKVRELGAEERLLTTTTENFKQGYIKKAYKSLISVPVIVIGILLGVVQPTNFWDFLIYFVFASMTFFLMNTLSSKSFADFRGTVLFVVNVGAILGIYLKFSGNVAVHIILQALLLAASYAFTCYAPTALTRTSFHMSFVFTVAHIIAAPFSANFDAFSNALGKCKTHSPIYQLFILWGTYVIIGLTFFVITIIYKNWGKQVQVKQNKKAFSPKPSIIGMSEDSFTNPVMKFFGQRNRMDIFVCGIFVVALMLIAAPEIFYVRDIYTSGYLRSNTMFKFAFAAFIMLGVVVAYAVLRLFRIMNKQGEYSNLGYIIGIAFCILLLIPAHYPDIGLRQRMGTISTENYKTLDGTRYLSTYKSERIEDKEAEGGLVPYAHAIEWFNENVSGSPVIVEAYGDSYTDNCIVSAYTGLPTVFGWQTHEWLWRFHGIINKEKDLLESDPDHDVFKLYINPRHADIDKVYGSDDHDEIFDIIKKYDIEYIVTGPMEAKRFGSDNFAVLSQFGDVVFDEGNLRVIKVNR